MKILENKYALLILPIVIRRLLKSKSSAVYRKSPFFPWVLKQLYSDEELDRMNTEENTPKEYKGKQYTTYEATQRQRRIETALRAKREEIHLLEQGGADADDILAKKAKYHTLSSEYAEFSKAMGLPQERQRVNISPFKGVDENIGKPLTKSAKALEKSGESGIIKSNKAPLKINIQLFAKPSEDFPTVILPKAEYAHIMSELETNITLEQRSKKVFKKAIGDYYYTIENNGAGNYRIIGKKAIK